MRNQITLVMGSAVLLGLSLLSTQAAAPATPQGFITARVFENIGGGTAVADLTNNVKFPNSPSIVRYEPYFELWATGTIDDKPVSDVKNNYGAQLAGYFYPATTGDYTFYISSDDNSSLYLSTDDNPANKKLIAIEPAWNNPRDYQTPGGNATGRNETTPENSSATYTGTQWSSKSKITLTAGKPYYIEALMKEGGGGDNLSVSIDGTLPIPGSMLSPFNPPATPTIVSQPQDVAVLAGGTAQLSVGLDVPPGTTLTSIKWQRNGTDVPTSDTNVLSVTTTAADNGAKYKAVVTTSKGTLTSSEATVTVASLTSDFAPGVVKFEAYNDITGTAISDLTGNDKFTAGKPDDVRLLAGIDSPNGYGDNYGAKVSGFIIPPSSGDYTFFLRSDDASQLWLSTDETEANTKLIAEEIGCCQAFLEPNADQGAAWHDNGSGMGQTTLTPITLTAGKKYAFYVLLKEGGGGDYVQVAARKAGDTTPAAGLRPLSGSWVGANAKPSLGDPQITTQPVGIPQLIEGRTGTLSLVANVTPSAYNFPALVQWQLNGKDIPGAISPTLTITNAAADNGGTYHAVVSAPSGKTVTSADVSVVVLPDTFPPAVSVGAVKNTNSTYDVGISFDEPVDAAAGTQANYSISAGTVTAFKYYPKTPGVVLTVSGLTAGSKYSVTVKDVADAKGNKITSVSKDFTAGNMTWGVVGGDELKLGNGVVAVGDSGFDVYSDSIAEWASYDEATFVYEPVTGDFDKKLRVEYQDSSSQWARAGLVVRDVTNIGVDRATQEGGAAGRYQKVHVNPGVTAMGTPGNNSWEGNRRIATGAATTSAGGGGTPLYPNAWCRLSRKGDLFTIYRSDDGVNWTQLGTTTFDEPMPATLYVGPEFAPENGNIGEDTGLRAMWLAKFRDYGNTTGAGGGGGGGGTGGTLSFTQAGPGKLTLTFQTGRLQVATQLGLNADWKDVTGAASPYPVNTSTGQAQYYRVLNP